MSHIKSTVFKYVRPVCLPTTWQSPNLLILLNTSFLKREGEKAHIQSPHELNHSSFYYEAKQDI